MNKPEDKQAQGRTDFEMNTVTEVLCIVVLMFSKGFSFRIVRTRDCWGKG